MNKMFNPKFFTLFKSGFSKTQIVNDIIAGVIVGVVALPLAIAFAVASGVSPEKGLITAVVAGFIISFLGGSRVQIGGPTGAFIVIVLGIVEQYGYGGLVISTMMAGVLLIVFGILRLGSLLKFIPHPMIVGFTSGIALVIFSTQLKQALGLTIDNIPSDFISKWEVCLRHAGDFNPWAVGIVLVTAGVILLTRKFGIKVPGSFIAIVVITPLITFFEIPVSTIGSTFGEIPTEISLSIPVLEWANMSHYILPALAIALLGGIESLLSAVVADGMVGGNHRSNTELIAQGIANVVTPFFGGIPATGAIARTATNVKNGGRTPIAGIVHAIVLLLIMMFVGKWAKLIPMSCLAGILIVVAYDMSEWKSFVAICKSSVFDLLILITTFGLTVFVDLVVAIEAGIVLSAMLFMKRMADVGLNVDDSMDSDLIEAYGELLPGINVYEINGPFFFATARAYSNAIGQIGLKSKVLIIRMRNVPFMDATGCMNLKLVLSELKSQNTTVLLSGVNSKVMKELNNHHLESIVGQSNIFDDFKSAVNRSEELISITRDH